MQNAAIHQEHPVTEAQGALKIKSGSVGTAPRKDRFFRSSSFVIRHRSTERSPGKGLGNRREPRVDMCLAVRIFGSDAEGHIFSEKVTTVNVSKHGVEVSGSKSKLKLDEIVGVTFAQNKSHFRVKWVGQADTPRGGHIGLLNLTPDKSLWNLPLPGSELDQFHGRGVERRQNPRLKATISVQIYPEGGSAIWGTSTDLGVGGCYVEMPIPLKSGTKLKVKLWVGENKLLAGGKVTNSTPGFGFGVQFTEIAENDLQLLKAFLRTITEV